ncbi:PhzF family phenazine biosynthesis protein [Geodermatophilus maliterrae]|uniref:PhzF family phenazine biosynthesis protein n=1 Tax=Geodermatophilus maliterrae TaxID=3162531 RepID=A0ABV3X9V9_9ACTN
MTEEIDIADHSHHPARGSTGDVEAGVPFAIVDVLSTDPLSGNPVAVVDMAGVDTPEPQQVTWMQAVAREFNQAETTFVLLPYGRPRTSDPHTQVPGRR